MRVGTIAISQGSHMDTLTPADSPLVASAEAWQRALCERSQGPMLGPGRIHKLLADARNDAGD